MVQGKLRSNKKVDLTVQPGAEGSLRAPNDRAVFLGEKGAGKSVAKTVILLTIGAIAVVFAIYTALGATLMRAIPEPVGGFTWVRNATFVGGIPDQGDYIYVSTKGPADNSALGKLKQTYQGVDGGATMVVVAGPNGNVSNDAEGNILWNEETTGYQAAIQNGSKTLGNQYLAICVEGECNVGNAYVVPQDAIVGESQTRISGDWEQSSYRSEE